MEGVIREDNHLRPKLLSVWGSGVWLILDRRQMRPMCPAETIMVTPATTNHTPSNYYSLRMRINKIYVDLKEKKNFGGLCVSVFPNNHFKETKIPTFFIIFWFCYKKSFVNPRRYFLFILNFTLMKTLRV